MKPEIQKIRDSIINSALSDQAKNEILPLLGVIDTPGIKERILKILEIEGKAADLQIKFVDTDIDNVSAPSQPKVEAVPEQMQPNVAAAPASTNNATEVDQLRAQMQQLQQ